MTYPLKKLREFRNNDIVYVPSCKEFGKIKHRYSKIVIEFATYGTEYSPNWVGAISKIEYDFIHTKLENEQLKNQLQAYKDKEDVYKKMWEELKAITKIKRMESFIVDTMQDIIDLEQKHNIKEY